VSLKINSNIQIKEWTKHEEGFLDVPVVVISEEVLDYPEFGTQEYVSPDIYSDKFLSQINGLPFVLEHPTENGKPVDVTSENYKRYIKGTLFNPEAQKDKKRVIATLRVYDKDTVEAIESGDIKELSAKYTSDDIKENGTFEGRPYNVKQTNMILNHLALTEAGRAGDKVKVLISKQNSIRRNNMADEKDDLDENGKKIPKANEDLLPPESAEHEAEEEETLQSLSQKVDQLTEMMTAVVDKIGGTDKANEDTAGGTQDKDELKKPMEKQNSSLSHADVHDIIAETNETMRIGKQAIGNDIYLVSQKYNSNNDAIMRHVLVKLGEYDVNSVKKLNSIDLRSEFRSASKYAHKLNSMKAPEVSEFQESFSGNDFFQDARFLQS